MNDVHDELPPPLSPEASAFLTEHAGTGAPAPTHLARVRDRMQERLLARRQTPPPSTARPPPRRWLRSEWMTAAAVVAVIVAAQGAYLAFHVDPPPPPPVVTVLEQPAPKTAQVRSVLDLYRAGKLDDAQRLAKAQCSAEKCGALTASLDKAAEMSERLEELTSAELQELAELDLALGSLAQTPLGMRVEKKRLKLPPNPVMKARAEQLLQLAEQQRKALQFEAARDTLHLCLVYEPRSASCSRVLGSVYASLAARDQSADDMHRATEFYERFLDLAPADDPYVPKVQQILEMARDDEQAEPSAESRTRIEGGTAPLTPADVWAARTELRNDPNNPIARRILEEADQRAKELYLRGYTLKDTDGTAAVAAFAEALSFSAPGSELAQKAKQRLDELTEEPQRAPTEPGTTQVRPQEPRNSDGGNVRVVARQVRSLPLKLDVQRVAVGDPNVADVVVGSPRSLQVRGIEPGKTTLLVWYTSGQRESFLISVVAR